MGTDAPVVQQEELLLWHNLPYKDEDEGAAQW